MAPTDNKTAWVSNQAAADLQATRLRDTPMDLISPRLSWGLQQDCACSQLQGQRRSATAAPSSAEHCPAHPASATLADTVFWRDYWVLLLLFPILMTVFMLLSRLIFISKRNSFRHSTWKPTVTFSGSVPGTMDHLSTAYEFYFLQQPAFTSFLLFHPSLEWHENQNWMLQGQSKGPVQFWMQKRGCLLLSHHIQYFKALSLHWSCTAFPRNAVTALETSGSIISWIKAFLKASLRGLHTI